MLAHIAHAQQRQPAQIVDGDLRGDDLEHVREDLDAERGLRAFGDQLQHLFVRRFRQRDDHFVDLPFVDQARQIIGIAQHGHAQHVVRLGLAVLVHEADALRSPGAASL